MDALPWVVPSGATGFCGATEDSSSAAAPGATGSPAAGGATGSAIDPGVTGGSVPPMPGPLPADLRAFARLCHQAARMIGRRVGSVTPAGPTPTFHTIEIARPANDGDPVGSSDVTTAVLRHVALPLVALARPRADGDMTLVFVDDPGLATAIGEISDLRVLASAELHTPLRRADLRALGPAEHRQIAYWKPDTVGELLFNFWD